VKAILVELGIPIIWEKWCYMLLLC